MNVSNRTVDSGLSTNTIIVSVFLIFIILFGIAGNIVSTFIFLQSYFRRLSINIFLAALSISDLLLLLLALPVCLTSSVLEQRVSQFINVLSAVYFYPMSMICHFCSIWFLVAVTLERWVAVCRPLKAAAYCERKNRALILALIVFLISLCFNFIRFWEFSPSPDWSEVYYNTMRTEHLYIVWYVTVGNLVILYIIPFTIMVCFNCKIALEIRRSRDRRRQMTVVQRSDQRTAKMLLLVVICFILCYTPSLVLSMLEAMDMTFLITRMGVILSHINNICVLLNGSTTCLFYFKCSSRYRFAAKLLFFRFFAPSVYEEMLLSNELAPRLYSATSPSATASRSRVSTKSRSSFQRDYGLPLNGENDSLRLPALDHRKVSGQSGKSDQYLDVPCSDETSMLQRSPSAPAAHFQSSTFWVSRASSKNGVAIKLEKIDSRSDMGLV